MCNASDRDALLAFKAQLIDTEGGLNDWDAQTNCCIWTVRLLLPLWILKLTISLHIIGHGRHHILQLCLTVSYVSCHSNTGFLQPAFPKDNSTRVRTFKS
jgi:hypothetical protein